MRILYFSLGYTTHDHRFLAALAQTDHEIHYLRLEPGSKQADDRPVPSQIHQVPWQGARGSFTFHDAPGLALALRRVIRSVQPDLIHAGPIQKCTLLAAMTGFHPLLAMSWGFDLLHDAERNRWWRAATRFALRRSDFFISDAQVTRSRAVEYGMDPDRTTVFPWGVDLEHFKPPKPPRTSTTRRFPTNHEPFVLLCSRAWEAYYGMDVLARAFVKVSAEMPHVRLLLLGGGSMAQSLRQTLMKGDALDRVQFGGQISQTDLPRWYHMADLYVSPSHIDGSSVSLMEALACGLPALVSDIPGNKEWVCEGQNGWLFPDGNADALAEKIRWVIQHKAKLARLRKAARQSAVERADWSKNFKALLAAYEQAVKSR